jgi:hypothetical protein
MRIKEKRIIHMKSSHTFEIDGIYIYKLYKKHLKQLN